MVIVKLYLPSFIDKEIEELIGKQKGYDYAAIMKPLQISMHWLIMDLIERKLEDTD